MTKIPYYKQETSYTCGPAALRMALAGLGIRRSEKAAAKLLTTNVRVGTRHLAFPAAAERLKLQYSVQRHAEIAYMRRALRDGYIVITCFAPKHGHYVVVTRVTKTAITFLDPIDGPNRMLPIADFTPIWHGTYGDNEHGWFFGVKR